jgi:[histone H3]-trimethyl-L-lysine4 demethylase
MKDRQTARQHGLNEILEPEDRPEEQYQCMICKSFCYLSQVTCTCTSKVVCVEHLDLLCDHPATHLTLRKRFSDEELLETQAKVVERAGIPSGWRGKLAKTLRESARPQLRTLRALLAEGERIHFPLPEISDLRKCVTRANEWIDNANTFIIRKQNRKRARRSRGRPIAEEVGVNGVDDAGDRPERGLNELYALLREVDNLGFDCQEIGTLRALAQQAEETKLKAVALLVSVDGEHNREAITQDCERLLVEGSSLNVHLDELLEVEKIVLRGQLIKELEEKLDDSTMTLEEVRQLLTRSRTCNLPPDDKFLKILESRQRAGDDWEERAKHILAQPYKTIDELDDFATMEPNVPMDPAILDRIMSARTKAKEFDRQAKCWLIPEEGAPKPKIQDALKLVARAEKDFSIPAIQDLKRTAEIAADLESRCEGVLKNKYAHPDATHPKAGDVFDTMRQWTQYAKDHLPMFSLPTFNKFEIELNRHYQWLKELPWYCENHRVPHGEPILDDVIECTRPDDDQPPADEYFTCICTSPVRPPKVGEKSDAVQCDHCFARFHGVCANNGGSCPFCDQNHWNGNLNKERNWHFSFLPQIMDRAPDITKNYSDHWKQLEIIIHRVDRLSIVIGQFLTYSTFVENLKYDVVPQVRHYMRKLYKIQFPVSPKAEISFGLDLAGLHRILAGQPSPVKMKKRRRPKFTFGQDVDKDWADGTRCICRGRTQYLFGSAKVQCDVCKKYYHACCVFYPMNYSPSAKNEFTCPLCCLRKNRAYPYSDVRVTHVGQYLPCPYRPSIQRC